MRHRRTITCYNSNRLHMLWCTNTNNLLEYLVITSWLLCDYIPLILFCFIKNIFENILYKVLYKNTLWILRKSSWSGHSDYLKNSFTPDFCLLGTYRGYSLNTLLISFNEVAHLQILSDFWFSGLIFCKEFFMELLTQ